MQQETLILLFDINFFDRKDAERIENSNYNSEEYNQIINMATNKEAKIWVCTMTDFMDICNNQEIDLDNYWISYVKNTKIK